MAAPSTPKPNARSWRLPIPLDRFILLLTFLVPLPVIAAEEINPPLGAYIHLRDEHFAEAASYIEGDRLVLTPYFYWYDSLTGAHLTDADGSDALTDHPPTLEGFSYRSVEWHAQELRDMEAAGIQVVLPVYWGEPSQRIPRQPVLSQPWSYSGIPPLIEARQTLLAEGKNPPRIGLFYDTSTLQFNAAEQQIDLTTPYGQQWFYESVRDFYSLLPPKHWAMIGDRPIIFLYSASFASRHDQACIEYLKSSFAQDFGGREPYIVREISWQVATEQVYAWGGALGLKNPGVASLGPGYDHSAVPGREPLILDREDGAFFERNWIRFLRRPSDLVMIETWNEYHEGTDIAESREYGRAYIEANRRFVDLFHQGLRPPLPRGPYSDTRKVSVQLLTTNHPNGLVQVESADGVTEPAIAGGQPCRTTVTTTHAGRYVYFRIDDSFKWADSMDVYVLVDYFDSAQGSFWIEFDGSDPEAPFGGAYTSAPERVQLGGTRRWLNARFTLNEGRLLNSQNAGSDFRIALDGDGLYVGRVTVERPSIPEEAGAAIPSFQQDFANPLDEAWQIPPGSPPLDPAVQGTLNLHPLPNGPQSLYNRSAGSESVVQEILARVRISRPPKPDQDCGGLLWGLSPSTGLSSSLQFVRTGAGESCLRLHASPLDLHILHPTDWVPNRWYWVRLRQDPAADGQAAHVSAKIWPADHEAIEPLIWPLQIQYPSGQSPDLDHHGLLGPSFAAATSLECDYLLAKIPELSPIAVQFPPLKPARPTLVPSRALSPDGFELGLLGSPGESYVIQNSSDLAEWDSVAVITDAKGWATYLEPGAIQQGLRLYRALVPNWTDVLSP